MPEPKQLNHLVVYLNGLNSGTVNNLEKNGFEYADRHGLHIKHLAVDWLTTEPFGDLLDEVVEACEAQLNQNYGLILVGASAGGSLAVNVLGKLRNRNIHVITLCSQLQKPEVSRWYMRNAYKNAHGEERIEDSRFYQSVSYCEATLSSLGPAEKGRITTVKQWGDEIVPRDTMNALDLRSYYVAGFGHQYGIFQGIRHLDRIITKYVR